ncbi:MAG: glycosyltransferase [Sphingomonadaceae bacterium]|nr:glycosyltransferase [Sphingomonadaceae bacterium]
MTAPRQPLRVHLTNVTGQGAVQLVSALLPALEAEPSLKITRLDLPDSGALAAYRPASPATMAVRYRRTLPNAVSRLVETAAPARGFDPGEPVLVLGDLPLNLRAPQVVLTHNPHTLPPRLGGGTSPTFRVYRAILHANLGRIGAMIVQTPLMADRMAKAYPALAGRIASIAQPPPPWLLGSGLRRTGPADARGRGLRLFYPAAGYPHKNHALLARLDPQAASLIDQLTLTIPPERNPCPGASWLRMAGRLDPSAMLDEYRTADALLFLSKAESFGFPLVEAMWLGLPIIAADLPYARTLCGEAAIYFDPDEATSLAAALCDLSQRLRAGWWPDWSAQRTAFPHDWAAVAAAVAGVVQRVAAARGRGVAG